MVKMTMETIATTVGVSTTTVSRAFQSPDLVRSEVLEKILRIAKEYDYIYNAAAGEKYRI